MKKPRLLGPLGSLMRRHLELRRSLGFQHRTDELNLDEFDQYVAHHFPSAATVTRPLVVAYLETTAHLHPTSRQHRVAALRQFCRFLFQLNPETYIPEKGLVPPRKAPLRPHLYRLAEVTRLMRLARQLPPSDSLRPHTYVTIIGLLWVSGLRIGEVLRLNLEDVDLGRHLLLISQTKNHQTRLVPITRSTSQALAAYRDLRTHYGHDQSPRSPFFVNQRAKRCVHKTVSSTFRAMTRQLGLRTDWGTEPRIHDLRHTFATSYLSGLYRTGQDPNAGLPILATYLGHVNIACTVMYLHPSENVLETAGLKFRDYAGVCFKLVPGGADARI